VAPEESGEASAVRLSPRAQRRLGGPGVTADVPGYVSKTDLVAALIRELIITGGLGPGEQLRQRDLAQRFGVSQTPVREAMRRLESEGLLVCDTHRGFTVVASDEGRVEENLQIRAALESLGASLAARKIDADGLARLRDLNEQMREAEPRVSLHGVLLRSQPAAAIPDAAALGVSARRSWGVAFPRRVRPSARRDPHGPVRRGCGPRVSPDLPAHNGRRTGKRNDRVRPSNELRGESCQRL
jgi:DNA-binding transcriptional regulator YhcF (GntR family)